MTATALFTGLASYGATVLTSSQLTSLVRDPGLRISARSVTVVGSGPVVTVLAEEDPKTSEQDLKIDAMFLSKTLIEAASGQIDTVKVVFSQGAKEGRIISVDNKEIQSFGQGKLTPAKLLASLRFTEVADERAPDVLPGPQYERRLLIWKRIEKLRAQGTGVAPFENIFHQIETAAKANDLKQVSERDDYLESKLSEQEEQIKQAKRTASGRGVPASSNGHQSVINESAGTDGMASILFVPPDADTIRKNYNQMAGGLITEVDVKDRTSGEKLRALKDEIDKRFAQGQQGAAFVLISQFGMLVHKYTGNNPFAPGPMSGGPQQHSASGGQGQGQGPGHGQGQKMWGQQESGGPGNGGPGNGPGGPPQMPQ